MNKKITDFPSITSIPDEGKFLVHDGNGLKNTTYSALKALLFAFDNSNTGLHATDVISAIVELSQILNPEYSEWEADAEAAFNEWFESVKNTMNEDVATNLLKLVSDIRDDHINISQTIDIVFDEDGNCTQTLADGRKKVVEFVDDNTVIETAYTATGEIEWKQKVTFVSDNHIREEVING